MASQSSLTLNGSVFMYGFTDTVYFASLHSTQLARHTLSAGRSRTRRRPGGALLEPLAVKFFMTYHEVYLFQVM